MLYKANGHKFRTGVRRIALRREHILFNKQSLSYVTRVTCRQASFFLSTTKNNSLTVQESHNPNTEQKHSIILRKDCEYRRVTSKCANYTYFFLYRTTLITKFCSKYLHNQDIKNAGTGFQYLELCLHTLYAR